MNRFAGWPLQWVIYLTASFYFGAVFLRSLLVFRGVQQLGQLLGILVFWLVIAAGEAALSRRWAWYFPLYLFIQTVTIFYLLTVTDFFGALLNILSMQVMLRLNPKLGVVWIGLCAVMMVQLLTKSYGPDAIALSLVYTAGNIFYGAYALSLRHAQEARSKNQALAQQLEEANHRLQAYSAQLEALAVVRERSRLARELHDSVTQTVFSMSLTIQSAGLLLKREPALAGAQLDRLSLLSQSALSELRLLISELPPEVAGGGLVSALQQHLANRDILENLSVTLEVEGSERLSPAEEQGLFRIAQEALNNVLKHARTSQAHICLHIDEPFWIEVEDAGLGFDFHQARTSGGVGLSSMYERAEEIGWDLQVITSPGSGTRIRVERPSTGRRPPNG